MSKLTSELLATAEEFCRRRGMSKSRLATIVVNDGKFFERVAAGGDFTVRTLEKFHDYFETENAKAVLRKGRAA